MEVRVTFLARDSRLSSTLLILRNNLTALEYVVIQGRGLEGQFSIDGVHPDTTSLLFQFSPSDLEKCEGKLQEEKIWRGGGGGAVTYVRWGGAVPYMYIRWGGAVTYVYTCVRCRKMLVTLYEDVSDVV